MASEFDCLTPEQQRKAGRATAENLALRFAFRALLNRIVGNAHEPDLYRQEILAEARQAMFALLNPQLPGPFLEGLREQGEEALKVLFAPLKGGKLN